MIFYIQEIIYLIGVLLTDLGFFDKVNKLVLSPMLIWLIFKSI